MTKESKNHSESSQINCKKQNFASYTPASDAIGSDNQECVDHWFRSSDDIRSGYTSGNTFDLKEIQYNVINDEAFFEGDIYLGQAREMVLAAGDTPTSSNEIVSGLAITGNRFRWPNGIIPFIIETNPSNKRLVLDAMQHWASLTSISFVERQAENPYHDNYVSFEDRDGCWSSVGMRGGYQVISIGPNCSFGSIVHEIGHTVGLWHEHGRKDRDQYIRILWENIAEGREHNFQQHITDSDDIGGYDYESIMHYPALAFSRNGRPTIIPINGETIGQRQGLSHWDIEAVKSMYGNGSTTPISSNIPKPPEPSVVPLGSIKPFGCRRWISNDWPVKWNVIWNVIPSSPSTRVEYNIVTERQSETLLRYYFEIRNLSGTQTDVEIRYNVL